MQQLFQIKKANDLTGRALTQWQKHWMNKKRKKLKYLEIGNWYDENIIKTTFLNALRTESSPFQLKENLAFRCL